MLTHAFPSRRSSELAGAGIRARELLADFDDGPQLIDRQRDAAIEQIAEADPEIDERHDRAASVAGTETLPCRFAHRVEITGVDQLMAADRRQDRKSTRLNSSH